MRLGVYTDPLLFRHGDTITADRAYLRFVLGLADRLDELVLFGRIHPDEQVKPYAVSPRPRVRHVPLPYYPRTSDARALARAIRGSRAAFAAELDRIDAVLVFGPNPLALELARMALRRRKPVVLGIRQDFPQYVRHRFRGRHGALAAGYVLEHAFRLLARRCATVVVGEDLARTFSGRGSVLSVGFSQIGRDDLVPPADAVGKSWDGELRLLSVGRLDPEKNPTLLVDVLARLRAAEPRWRLEIVGEGRLQEAVRERARELGVEPALTVTGYVPAGPALWERYRAANAFLHASWTEGVPSVLFEAQASGIPVVATNVGGVAGAVQDGLTGLLVPPGDPVAAADALSRIASDRALRESLVTAALESVAERTMDAELDRLARFVDRHARAAG